MRLHLRPERHRLPGFVGPVPSAVLDKGLVPNRVVDRLYRTKGMAACQVGRDRAERLVRIVRVWLTEIPAGQDNETCHAWERNQADGYRSGAKTRTGKMAHSMLGWSGDDLGLFTDLYELTMAQVFFEQGMFSTATFSLFIRNHPPNRGYMVFAGLEDVLEYLEGLSFDGERSEYLRTEGIFSEEFLEYLAGVRFTGSVRAMAEGRLFFANEPVLEVTGPIIEAQLVETYIINQVNLQSLQATRRPDACGRPRAGE